MDLSIVIPAWNEKENLLHLIPSVNETVGSLGLTHEVIVVNQPSGSTETIAELEQIPCTRVLQQATSGYGSAILQGISAAKGDYIVTMDADFSHNPSFLADFWNARNSAEIVIGSRYVKDARADMTLFRKFLSRVLNVMFGRGLSLPWKDLSSGFRLYKASVVKSLKAVGHDFDVLQEILIRCYADGSKVSEIPIHYQARRSGSSHARLIKFGLSYMKTFYRMWKLRNSIDSADYDDRAFDSIIPVQKYWQRKRCDIIEKFTPTNTKTLDIGCGSTRMLGSEMKPWGLDIRLNKLRYARKFQRPLVNGSVFALPFIDQSFDCVICSEVIEHIAGGDKPFTEMRRLLKPGGTLVIGTPDYAHRTWRWIEAIYGVVVPGGYADEHITHYTYESLTSQLKSLGFEVKSAEYIMNSELILLCKL